MSAITVSISQITDNLAGFEKVTAYRFCAFLVPGIALKNVLTWAMQFVAEKRLNQKLRDSETTSQKPNVVESETIVPQNRKPKVRIRNQKCESESKC